MTFPKVHVVDTSVISLSLKDREPTRLTAYRSVLDGSVTVLSFMTVAEVWQWAEERNWGEGRRNDCRKLLSGCVVDQSTSGLCQAWAYLMGSSRRGGHNLGHADAWIAATALARDAPLVSENTRHFAWIPGLRLLTVS